MICVLVLPVIALALLTALPYRCPRRFVADAYTPNSIAMQVLGPAIAPFRFVNAVVRWWEGSCA